MGKALGHHAASVAFGYAVHGQRAHTPAAQSRGSCPPQAPCCGPRDRHQRYHPFLRQCSPGSLPRLSRFTQSLQVVAEVLRRPNQLVWCRLPDLRVHWWRRPSRSSLEPPLHEHSCCRSRCHDRRLGAPLLRRVLPNPRHERHQPQVPQLEPGACRPRPVHLIHQSCHTWFRSRQYSSAPTESVSCHQQIRDIRRVVSWQLGCVVQIEISSAHSRLGGEQRTGVCGVQLRAIRSSSWRCTRQPWHRRLRRDWSNQTRRLPMLTQVGLYHTHLLSCCWSASWQPNMWRRGSCAARAETMHCAQQYTRHSAVPIVCFRPIPRGRPIQRRNSRPDSQLHLCCCGGSVSPSRGTGSRHCCDTWCGCSRCALCCIQL